MKSPVESIMHFCLIQLEIIKTREIKLRKDIQDCGIQREFLSEILKDLGHTGASTPSDLSALLNTKGNPKK